MPDGNEIYQFLKTNNLTDKDESSFVKEYSDPEKAEQLHKFFVDNKLTDKDSATFYDTYLKKKGGTQPATNPSNGILQPSANGGVNTSQLKSQSVSPLQPKEQTYDGLLGQAIQKGNEMEANKPFQNIDKTIPIGSKQSFDEINQRKKDADSQSVFTKNKHDEAQANTVDLRLKAKGLKPTVANKTSELLGLRKDIENGDADIVKTDKGYAYGRVPTWHENIAKTLYNTAKSIGDTFDIYTTDPLGYHPEEVVQKMKDIADRKNKEEHTKFDFATVISDAFDPESITGKSRTSEAVQSADLSQPKNAEPTLGGKAAGFIAGIAPDLAVATATGGTSIPAQVALRSAYFQAKGMGETAMDLYHRKVEELKQQGVPQEQAELQAVDGLKGNAALSQVPNTLMQTYMFHEPLKLPALDKFSEVVGHAVGKAAKMTALGATQEAATQGIEGTQGYNPEMARIGENAKQFAMLEAVFGALGLAKFGGGKLLGKIPKPVEAYAKEVAVQPEIAPLVAEQLKEDPNGETIAQKLSNYANTTAPVRELLGDKMNASVGGRVELINKLKEDIATAEEQKKVVPEIFHPTIDETINGHKERIAKLESEIGEIQKTDDPLKVEHDDVSGQPLKSTTVIMPKPIEPIAQVDNSEFKKGDQVTLPNGKKGEISEIKDGKARVVIKSLNGDRPAETRDLGWHDLADIEGEAKPIEKTKEQVEAQGRVDDFVNGLAEANPELHKIATDNPIAALDKLIDHHKEQLKGTTPTTKAYSEKAIAKFEALKEDYKLANEIKTDETKGQEVVNKDAAFNSAASIIPKEQAPKSEVVSDVKTFRVGKQKGDFTFSSKTEDYANEYGNLMGFKDEAKEHNVSAKNPLTVELSHDDFTDYEVQKPILEKAKADGHDLVIFKPEKDSGWDGEEFYVEIKQPKENETQKTKEPNILTNEGRSTSNESLAAETQSNSAAEVDEVKSAASKTKVSQSLRDKAKEVREKGYNEAFKLPHIKLDEGTQTAGFGGKGLDNAIAKSLEIVADSIDAGKELFDSAKDGFEHLKDYYAKNSNRFDEDKLRDEFINGIAENKQEADKLREQFSKKEPPKPPIEEPKGETSGNSNEAQGLITKEELSKHEQAKKLFESEGKTTWNETVDKAVTNLIKDNPKLSVEDAAQSHVDNLAMQYDAGKGINPTAEDLAIINLAKLNIEQKLSSPLHDINSDNVSERDLAIKELTGLNDKLLKVAKAANPREAGLAFGIRQMLLSMKDGLQIRRMELTRQKGEKLSKAEMDATREEWIKEKRLMEEKADLEKKAITEKFEAELKAQADKIAKLTVQSEKPTITEKAKKMADNFRKLKSKPFTFKDDKGNDIPIHSMGFSWNDMVEYGARAIEKTGEISDGVKAIVDKIKDTDFYKGLSDKKKVELEEQLATHYTDGLEETPEVKTIRRLQKELEDLHRGIAKQKGIKIEDTQEIKDLKDEIFEAKKNLGLIKGRELPKEKQLLTAEEKKINRLEKQLADLQQGIVREKVSSIPDSAEATALKEKIFEEKKKLGLVPSKGSVDSYAYGLTETLESRNIRRLEKELDDARNGIFKEKSEKRELSAVEKDLQDQIFEEKKKAGLVASKEQSIRETNHGLEITNAERQIAKLEKEKADLENGTYNKNTNLNEKPSPAQLDKINKLKDDIGKLKSDLGILKSSAIDKINKLADGNGTITKEMVANNAIKDFIHSYVGKFPLDKVSDIAFKKLKEILPNITKEQFKEAYLKRGEFKIETESELKNEARKQQQQYNRLTDLENRLGELKKKKDLLRDSDVVGKEKLDEAISKAKDAISTELVAMGKKISNASAKYKETIATRSESHNANIKEVSTEIDALKKGADDKTVQLLDDLKAKIESSKVDYEPLSKLDQTSKLNEALDKVDLAEKQLKSIKKQLDRDTYYDLENSIQKIKDRFNEAKEEATQEVLLDNAKKNAVSRAKEYERKINAKEFDNTVTKSTLTRTDVELVKNERELAIVKSAYDKRAEQFRKKNRKGWEVGLESAKNVAINLLIGSPKTFFKLAVASPAKIIQTYFSKATFGKLFEKLADKGFVNAARSGGESSSNQAMNRGLGAIFTHKNSEELAKKSDAQAIEYSDSAEKYEKAKAETKSVLESKGNGKEYQEALKKEERLKQESDYKLKASIGNTIEQYIGGSTLKTMQEKLMKRNTQYENMMGHFSTEDWTKINFSGIRDLLKADTYRNAADNISYLFGFFGRSHGALKSISARYHFATGFMARIEASLERGEDISDFGKLQQYAAESYTDWESGMYQQDNWVTSRLNKVINDLKTSDRRGERIIGNLASWDVAITKVPVNQINEAVIDMTLGLPIAIGKYGKEYYKAKGIVTAELGKPLTVAEKAHFKEVLSEQLSKVDKKTAATIARMFRHGGFGLGIMGLAVATGYIKYGGHPHLGQKREDAAKGDDELKTSEIEMGDTKLNEYVATALEHTTSMFPALSYLSMKQQYEKDFMKGKSDATSVADATYKQLEYIINSYPQSKIFNPLKSTQRAADTYKGAVTRRIEDFSFGLLKKEE